jgi:fused signal recognition particle receptor
VGETVEDLEKFDPDDFVKALFETQSGSDDSESE